MVCWASIKLKGIDFNDRFSDLKGLNNLESIKGVLTLLEILD